MFALTNNADIGARLCVTILERATCDRRGTDLMAVVQYLAGVFVETSFVFARPDDGLNGILKKLSARLDGRPYEGPLATDVLPPAHVIDRYTEQGRQIARDFFEQWLDCEFSFCDVMVTIVHNLFVQWEGHGIHRAESLRLLIECARRAMAYEVTAQELCDVIIENKMAYDQWGLAECVVSLSAASGRRLAMTMQPETAPFGRHIDDRAYAPSPLEHLTHVMTQEAIRLGVPAGSDWRFGLAANDVPVSAPEGLIQAIEPYCHSFFATIGLFDRYDQAVALAKAAGRMVAVAAGGEDPQMEPVIAKPLAMGALSDTYKSVCLAQASVMV